MISAVSLRPPPTTAKSLSQVMNQVNHCSMNTVVWCVAGTSLCEIQVQDGSTIELEDSAGVCYSLWVSFAEIYNELIYDLLAEEPCKTRRSRPALKLAEDRNHNHFIKGP